jgi:UDP-N-acetylglucosamine:LPS N-acetylglucosamine transferase
LKVEKTKDKKEPIKSAQSELTLCFAASSGGHLEQLLMLAPLMEKYPSFLVTEHTSYRIKINIETYQMLQVNRKEVSLLPRMIVNSFHSLYLLWKKKPDLIICTGVLAMIPLCLLGKVFGAKLVFIESFAKIDSPTLTGKFLYKYADQFYVQWEGMKKFYPNAIYLGGIY